MQTDFFVATAVLIGFFVGIACAFAWKPPIEVYQDLARVVVEYGWSDTVQLSGVIRSGDPIAKTIDLEMQDPFVYGASRVVRIAYDASEEAKLPSGGPIGFVYFPIARKAGALHWKALR